MSSISCAEALHFIVSSGSYSTSGLLRVGDPNHKENLDESKTYCHVADTVAVAVLALAACGGGGAPAEEPAAEEPAAAEEAAPAEEAAEEPAAEEEAAPAEEEAAEEPAEEEEALGAFLVGDIEGPKIITDEAAFPTELAEAPMLTEMVEAGELPPLEERLPPAENLLVIEPVHEIGKYGGTWHRGFTGPG